ncbi:hypothetical protein BOTBODRAFT_551693 [Botryobasidium botryosum FD-172 SS1]|uniref:DUF3074 domain-containing protein n=1 Tax=Botryobasidium botryosum (strain FD-172 SS1) TaxID=930990 RepID=A0A067N2Z0_BOTB1|nr:hypothetical protein BOTBODRAFT_551693 [Botryobasidium botryosum FD-172 SS1]
MSLLSLDPVKLSNVPSSSDLLAAAREHINSSTTWTQKKSVGNIKIFTTKSTTNPGGPAWHCRVSEHGPDEATFDEFWQGLGVNHSLHEKEYIPEIQSAVLVTAFEPGVSEAWTMHYKLGLMVSRRTFTELVVTHLEETADTPGTPKVGWLVSIPFDASETAEHQALETKGVRGKYVSIEKLTQLEDNKVEWRMATCSTPGGWIPQFLSEMAIPGAIAKDVPHFLEWVKKNRTQAQ